MLIVSVPWNRCVTHERWNIWRIYAQWFHFKLRISKIINVENTQGGAASPTLGKGERCLFSPPIKDRKLQPIANNLQMYDMQRTLVANVH